MYQRESAFLKGLVAALGVSVPLIVMLMYPHLRPAGRTLLALGLPINMLAAWLAGIPGALAGTLAIALGAELLYWAFTGSFAHSEITRVVPFLLMYAFATALLYKALVIIGLNAGRRPPGAGEAGTGPTGATGGVTGEAARANEALPFWRTMMHASNPRENAQGDSDFLETWALFKDAGFPVWVRDVGGALICANASYLELFPGGADVSPDILAERERKRSVLVGAQLGEVASDTTLQSSSAGKYLVQEFVLEREGRPVGRIGFGMRAPGTIEEASREESSAHVDHAVLSAVLEFAPVGIAISLINHGEVWAVSRKIFDILGTQHQTVIEPFPPMALDDLPAHRTPDSPPIPKEERVFSRALRGETVHDEEQYFRQPNGEFSRALVSAGPIRDANGELMGAVATWRDITRLSRLEEELADLLEREKTARKQAEDASRQKDQFVASISHELRTPLSAITGWAHVLEAKGVKMEHASRAIKAILNNARAQAQLIDQLLDMSRIVSGRYALEFGPVNLADSVVEALETVAPAADERQITIDLDLQAQINVSADKLRIRQVVWNILNNAIKFSPTGAAIQVSLTEQGRTAQLVVSDAGEGIAPDFLPHVFDHFTQDESAGHRRHGGLGLGMAIAKHIVEAHGGLLRAASPGKGQGATFTLQLPLAAYLSPVRPGQRQAHLELGRKAPLEGRHILTVEDQQDSRDVVKLILEEAGATVSAASSAGAGLEALSNIAFDALVTDLAMPGMDGIQLVEAMQKQLNHGVRPPAILLTAFDDQTSAALARGAGFYATLAKPVSREELVQTVARACAEHESAAAANPPRQPRPS